MVLRNRLPQRDLSDGERADIARATARARAVLARFDAEMRELLRALDELRRSAPHVADDGWDDGEARRE